MTETKKPRSYFPYFLGGICVLFIGIMLFVYQGAKKANPVMLNEHGLERGADSGARHK